MSPFGHPMLAHWTLDPGVTYLNHGTVGATPRRVLAAQQAIRDRIERQPAHVLLRETADFRHLSQPLQRERALMREAADAIGAFLGARGDDVVFVDNATAGVGAVLGSLDLRPGDEIVVNDHSYGAVVKSAQYWASRAGASVRVVELPFPWSDPPAIVAAIAAALGPRTRLAIVDHVSSGSALVMPLAELVARCRAAGVPVLVDGAHAPGALPVDLGALGADWYTGNLHKWAMAPRSCGVLWTAPKWQGMMHPPVISWGVGSGYVAEFDWTGTRDPSPWLAAPEGIAFMRELGIDAMRGYQHELAWDSAQRLGRRWGDGPPMRASQVGGMVTLPLPARAGATGEDSWRLRLALFDEDRIEVQMHPWRDRLWIRISAQVYNAPEDVEQLAQAIDRRL
jgi:isopenicillin-N epimerase